VTTKALNYALTFFIGALGGYLFGVKVPADSPNTQLQAAKQSNQASRQIDQTVADNTTDTSQKPIECQYPVELSPAIMQACIQRWHYQGGRELAVGTLLELIADNSSAWAHEPKAKAELARQLRDAGDSVQAALWLLAYAMDENNLERSDRALTNVKQTLSQWWQQREQSAVTFTEVTLQYLQQKPDDSQAHWWLAQLAHSEEQLDIARYHALLARTAPAFFDDAEQLLASMEPNIQISSGTLVVPLNRNTNQYLLTGMIAGEQLTFLVDTGASISAISHAFAQQNLAHAFTDQRVLLQTAGGNYQADIVKIDTLALGENFELSVNNKELVVLSEGASHGFDALLGLDILARFHFAINADDRSLVLQLP
jgi:aspartyl protease family protein